MRVLVLSDTHGHIERVIELLKKDDRFDHIIHLGDNVQDAQDIESIYDIPISYVAGNCDFLEVGVVGERILTFCGHKLLLTHGHTYGVKNSLSRLREIIYSGRANSVLFGHTHRSLIEYCDNGLIFNPGSISSPRENFATFGILKIEKNQKIQGGIVEIRVD